MEKANPTVLSHEEIAEILDQLRTGKTTTLEQHDSFRNVDLSGLDLSGLHLEGMDFSATRFFGADLRHTSLAGALLEDCDFTTAKMANADLSRIHGARAGFGMADLQESNFFEAQLQDASFTKAKLNGADFRCTNLYRARMREADLQNVEFTEANLDSADLGLSHLSGACFRNTNLANARIRMVRGFKKANWLGVDIRNINFAGAFLLRRFINDQNYLYEFRNSGKLAKALYYVWWATSDCGRSLSRWCFWIFFQAIFFAWLNTQVDIDLGKHPTWLSHVYYSVVTLTTLGYGDITPASAAAQFVAMIEVIAGYVMLGGLLSLFTNKIARRAD